MSPPLTRRELVKTGAVAGAGLVLGVQLVPRARNNPNPGDAETFAPNAFVRVGSDGRVTVLVAHSEMGQGVATSLPMLVAEELEVDWRTVSFEMAPAHHDYDNALFMFQGTGGSTSVIDSFTKLRKAGAAARLMLVGAAAARWGVDASGCRAEGGEVVHAASRRRIGYGALVADAARRHVPSDPPLKPRSEWKILGRPVRRLDSPAKVTGSAEFGIDVRLPGMLTAVVARCPVFGGTARRFDARAALRVAGVHDVKQISTGVAVLADGFWAAKAGREALVVEWDEGPNAAATGATISDRLAAAAHGAHAVPARRDGHADRVLAAASRKVEATYEVPFLAHACMEPMNCTAHVRADGCEVWAPTQWQGRAQVAAADAAGLPPAKVQVHTTMLGGGFGRRSEHDFVTEAVELSKSAGRPVKVIWTRDDDLQHDFYRPAAVSIVAAALGEGGMPVAWRQRIAAPSISRRIAPAIMLPFGLDPYAVEGAADLPYAIPDVLVDWTEVDTGVPVGWWRSVGHSYTTFFVESFVDELAAAAGADPVDYRRALLAHQPRLLAVLNAAAQRAGWGTTPPAGRARGVAIGAAYGSYTAQVAEVELADRGPRVHRVTCAFDCGTVINPDTVEAQLQGAIVYGLSAALYGAVTIDKGRVTDANFDTCPALRMNEMPEIDVVIVPGDAPPGGAGESGTPPIAPAVANALFALTGKRVRKLPLGAAAR